MMEFTQNRYIILIGIPEYHDDIKRLPYAANDAYRLYTVLKNCGYVEEKMFLLTQNIDNHSIIFNPPTLKNIFDVIHLVVKEARPSDIILFYYAGYGVDIFKRPYLLTQDTQLDFLLSTAIDLSDLLKRLQQAKAQRIIQILDICRSHFAENRTLNSKMTSEFQEFLTQPANGHATFCSCSANEFAHESVEYKQGIFSYYLNNALEQGVGIQDEFITLDQVVEYVKNNVMEWTYKRKLKQTPFYISKLPDTLILCKNVNKKQAIDFVHKSHNFRKPEPDYIQTDIEQETEFDTAVNSISNRQAEINTFYNKKILNKRLPDKVNVNQFDEIYELLLKNIDSYIRDFSHPFITIYRTEPVELKVLSYFINQVFEQFINNININEPIKDTKAIQIFFKNAESNAPETSLYLNIVQFSNFYWIWYCLPFETLRMQGDFVPSNPLKIDYISLRPPFIYNTEKLNLLISDIFRDCTETLIDWTQQLHEFQFSKNKK